MSTLRVDTITDEAGTGPVEFTSGITGDGSGLTSLTAGNLTGTLPAIDGSALTSLAAGNLTGTLPAIDGSALTGISSTPTTADVLSATAGATAGAVGTYAYLINLGGNIGITPSATTAGSSLRYSAQSTNSLSSASGYSVGHTYSSGPSGTWRAMGGRTATGTYTYPATLYVRIS